MSDKELEEYTNKIEPNFNSHLEKGTIEMSNEYYNLLEEKMVRLINKNQELKSQLKGTTHCFDEEEHEKLKKQLEEYKATNKILSHELTKDKVLQQDCLTTCCGIPIGDIPKLITQQKEFIKWLEDYLKLFDKMDIDAKISYDMFEEILQKYKEIIGDDK